MRPPTFNTSDTLEDAKAPTLLQRRVPQIVGLYLAGSYTVFEMAQWIVKRFELGRVYEDLSLFGLLSFLPAVVLLAWGHGAPGRDRWSVAEKICLPINLVVTLGLLTLIWSARAPAVQPVGAVSSGGAAEAALPMKRDAGVSLATVPSTFGKARATVLACAFSNRGKGKATDWMAHGIPLGLEIDLGQEPRVTVHALASGGLGEDLRKAGYQGGVGVPVAMMLQVAQDGEFDHFLTGSYQVDDSGTEIELRLYEAKKGTLVATLHGTGSEMSSAIDELTIQLKESLGLSAEEIAEERDLATAEVVSASLPAFEEFTLALVDENFGDNFAGAMQHMDRALKLDPTFAFAHLRRAYMMLAHSKWDELAISIAAALKHRYRLSESSIFVAQVVQLWLVDKKPAEALLAIEQWTKHSPRHVMARQMQLNIKSGLGDFAGALEALEALQAVESKMTYDKLHAELLVELGRHVEAQEEYADFVTNYPKEHAGYLGLASTLQILGEHDRSLDAYQRAVAVAPTNPKLLQSLAKQLVDMGKYEEALDRLNEALRFSLTDSERAQTLEVLSAFYEYRGRLALAIATLEKSWALKAGMVTADEMVASKMQSAWLFAQAGREEDGLALSLGAKPIMTSDPNSLGAFRYHAAATQLYVELGDLASAQLASDETQRIGQSYGVASGRLAAGQGVLLSKLGKHNEAIAAYQAFLKESPNELELVVYLGDEELALGNLDAALGRADFVLTRQPAQPRAHLLAAKVQNKQGKRALALDHVKQALVTWADADENFSLAAEARALEASLRAPSAAP